MSDAASGHPQCASRSGVLVRDAHAACRAKDQSSVRCRGQGDGHTTRAPEPRLQGRASAFAEQGCTDRAALPGMRRLLPAVLALPLLVLPAFGGSAAAENRVFSDARGDGQRPANDIVSYSVNYTTDQVAVVVNFAAPNTDELDLLHRVDANGDGTDDFVVFPHAVYRERGFETMCSEDVVRFNRSGAAAGISFPASCVGSPAALRVQVSASTGSVGWDDAPTSGTWSPSVRRGAVDVGGTPPPAGTRGVSIGIRQASGVYTFSGTVTPAEAGVQVTTARLDGVSGRVTGVASTRTDAAGRYTIRTRLPAGMAGYYSLSESRSGFSAGRSRLYGLVVPR